MQTHKTEKKQRIIIKLKYSMKIVYLNCHGTRVEYQNKLKMENSTVWTYKGKSSNDYAFKSWYEMPG
jgi:hypothetical protein